jgi:hypothetical protein
MRTLEELETTSRELRIALGNIARGLFQIVLQTTSKLQFAPSHVMNRVLHRFALNFLYKDFSDNSCVI